VILNTSASLQTALTAEAHVAEEQTLNIDSSLMYRIATQRAAVSKRGQNLNIIQFLIIYVPSQQLQRQLQTRHGVDTGNHIKDKHSVKT
jgi:hypothetical protein